MIATKGTGLRGRTSIACNMWTKEEYDLMKQDRDFVALTPIGEPDVICAYCTFVSQGGTNCPVCDATLSDGHRLVGVYNNLPCFLVYEA